MLLTQFSLKAEFPISSNHGVVDRKKNLQDAEIWLKVVPDRERSPFLEHFFWLTWAKAMGSALHLQSSFLELILLA
jgi:hypothetical protein